MQYCRKCPDAVAEIRGGMETPQLTGCVQFFQERGCVLIVARIFGMPRESKTGFFGCHIHQGADCSLSGKAQLNQRRISERGCAFSLGSISMRKRSASDS